MNLTPFEASKLVGDDVDRWMADMRDFGIAIVKDGKRVDPRDFYAAPPEQPYTWEG